MSVVKDICDRPGMLAIDKNCRSLKIGDSQDAAEPHREMWERSGAFSEKRSDDKVVEPMFTNMNFFKTGAGELSSCRHLSTCG